MASKFKQFLDEIINGHEPEPEKAQAPEQEQAPEQAQAKGQDMAWLDEEVEKQKGQEIPDEAYAVGERDEPAPEPLPEQQQEQAPEQAPEHEPATGEITPGQSDIQHDGLQQDGSMDRDTMSDGLQQGGGMDEIEM